MLYSHVRPIRAIGDNLPSSSRQYGRSSHSVRFPPVPRSNGQRWWCRLRVVVVVADTRGKWVHREGMGSLDDGGGDEKMVPCWVGGSHTLSLNIFYIYQVPGTDCCVGDG